MTIEQQATYLKIIEDDFIGMKNMLDDIRLKIASAVMPNIAKIMSNFGCMGISSVASIWLTDV